MVECMMYRKNMALPFGQYKGVFISDILETDPGYLLWCMENVKDFDLELSVYEEAFKRSAKDLDYRDFGVDIYDLD